MGQAAHAVEQAAQGLPFQVLHDDEGGLVELVNVVDLDDMGVDELGNDVGLLAEALLEAGLHGHVVLEHLDGHGHVQDLVPALVDQAPAPLTDLVLDHVLAHGPVRRHWGGLKTVGDQLGEEDAQIGMLRGHTVKLLLVQPPDHHVGLGDHIGAARLTGQHGHFPHQVTALEPGHLVAFPVLDHGDHTGAALDDVQGVAGLTL